MRLPEGWTLQDAGVLVGDTLLMGCDSFDRTKGTFRIEGVPDGRWTVRVRTGNRTDDRERTLDAEASAGGTVEIDAR